MEGGAYLSVHFCLRKWEKLADGQPWKAPYSRGCSSQGWIDETFYGGRESDFLERIW